MTREYQRTLSDIDIILDNMGISQKEKIPLKLRNFIHENKLAGYISNIKTDKPLEEQNVHEDTKAFLAMLYLNYWCENVEEKEAFSKQLDENERKYQEELREKYNPDNIFKKPEPAVKEENIKVAPQMQLVEYHESWIRKMIEKLLSIFRRKNHYER